MDSFTTLTAVAAPMPMQNIDTDKIIPARFLKTIKRSGLGVHLFDPLRFNKDGSENPDFVLNREPYRKAQIIIAHENFGCGSSREHAPWALTDAGFRAVVSTSFADIFYGNSLKNALLPIKVTADVHRQLLAAGSGARVKVDLEHQTLTLPDGSTTTFPVDAFPKRCMLLGVDELGYLLQFSQEIDGFEAGHQAGFDTRAKV